MFNRGDVFVFIMMVGKCFFVGRMQSSYYARLRRKMNLDKKKRGVDSFNEQHLLKILLIVVS